MAFVLVIQRYHKSSNSLKSELSRTAPDFYNKDLAAIDGKAPPHESTSADSFRKTDYLVNSNPSDGRVMLIDGTSIIYRSYYKLLGKNLYFVATKHLNSYAFSLHSML